MDQKKRKLVAGIIRDLHAGLSVEDAKARVQREVGTLTSTEVTTIEQSLIDEGVSPDEIKRFCNVHALIFEASLEQAVAAEDSPSHPLSLLRAENRTIEGIVAELRTALAPGAVAEAGVRAALAKLKGVDRHYALKENAIFPYLEQHGFMGPSQVMWGKHNEVRQLLRDAEKAATGGREGHRGRPHGRVRAARRRGRGHDLQGGEHPLPRVHGKARARGVGEGARIVPGDRSPVRDAACRRRLPGGAVAAEGRGRRGGYRLPPERPGIPGRAGRPARRAARRHQLRRRRRHGAVLQPDEGPDLPPGRVGDRQERAQLPPAAERRARWWRSWTPSARASATTRISGSTCTAGSCGSGTSRCATRSGSTSAASRCPRTSRGRAASPGERRLLDDGGTAVHTKR